MLGILVVFLLIMFLCVAFLFLIAPNHKKRKEIHVFEQQLIAHRGLFNNQIGIPENSMLAFSKAIEKHFGIELDVQMTTDNKLVVFHDDNLKRMCGVDKRLTDCSFEELKQYTIGNSSEHIPLFDDVLSLIDGKVPIIVEIKSDGNWKETTIKTAQRLDNYNGKYCIESFHPFVVHWFRKNRPSIIRGQLSTNYYKDNIKVSNIQKFLLSNLFLNCISRPDFIAYNHKHVCGFCYSVCRKVFTVTNAAWTIKNQDELIEAKKVFSIIIFDSFFPI